MAVFISGGGTTLQNFIDRIGDGTLKARISVVLSSREDAYGLVRAERAGIPTVVVPSRRFGGDWEAMSAAIDEALEGFEFDLVAMAGFMCFYRIPPQLHGRVMNIHPALIPAFCGKGMYGMRVHRAVLEAGVKVSGCTVHFADNAYDHGPIIIQRCVPVLDDDTPESLSERVFREECRAYPEAINLFAEGRLSIEGRKVRIRR